MTQKTLTEAIVGYEKEFQIKVVNPDQPYIHFFKPDDTQAKRFLEIINSEQDAILEACFGIIETLPLTKQAYENHYNAVASKLNHNIEHTAIHELIIRLEKYTDDLITLKTVNEHEKTLIEKHILHHKTLSHEFSIIKNDTSRISNQLLGKSTEIIDTRTAQSMREKSHETHLVLTSKLQPLVQKPSSTISTEDYRYISENVHHLEAMSELNENNNLVDIIRKYITIEPGFEQIKQQIQQALYELNQSLLMSFMDNLNKRITSIAATIASKDLHASKMVLIVNFYLRTIKHVIPKLSLACSNMHIRINEQYYDVSHVFSHELLNESYPPLLVDVNGAYCKAINCLKDAFRQFIIRMVKDINQKTIEFSDKPTQPISDIILEYAKAHDESVQNYTSVFGQPNIDEQLALFEIDHHIEKVALDHVKFIYKDLARKVTELIDLYQPMKDTKELSLHLASMHFIYLSHQKHFGNNGILSFFNRNNSAINDKVEHMLSKLIDKIKVVNPALMMISIYHVLFVYDHIFPMFRVGTQYTHENVADIIKKMITQLLINPKFKPSRVIYNDISLIIYRRIEESERPALTSLIPCTDFNKTNTDIPQAQNFYLKCMQRDVSNDTYMALFDICHQDVSSLTTYQYTLLLQEFIENRNTKMASKFFQLYLSSYEFEHQLSHIHYIRHFYTVIRLMLSIPDLKANVLRGLINSSLFTQDYPLNKILSMTQGRFDKEKLADIIDVHQQVFDYASQQSKPRDNCIHFKNQALIIMKQSKPTIDDDPLKTKASTIAQQKQNNLSIFVSFVAHYLEIYHFDDVFEQTLALYVDHLYSIGTPISVDQAKLLLSQVISLPTQSFMQAQEFTLRVIRLCPSPNQDLMNTIFIKAAECHAHHLADGMLDDNDISIQLTDHAINRYNPTPVVTLSEVAQAILAHFSRKIPRSQVTQPLTDVAPRLHKQMRKLDRVMMLIDTLMRLNKHDSSTINQAVNDIADIENVAQSFFKVQQQMTSSLSVPVRSLSNEQYNAPNLENLKSQLLLQYEKLLVLMVTQVIGSIESSNLQNDMKIRHLQIIHRFFTARMSILEESLDHAKNTLSQSISEARTLKTWYFNPPTDVEVFFTHITPESITIKSDYHTILTDVGDAIHKLGGTISDANSIIQPSEANHMII